MEAPIGSHNLNVRKFSGGCRNDLGTWMEATLGCHNWTFADVRAFRPPARCPLPPAPPSKLGHPSNDAGRRQRRNHLPEDNPPPACSTLFEIPQLVHMLPLACKAAEHEFDLRTPPPLTFKDSPRVFWL